MNNDYDKNYEYNYNSSGGGHRQAGFGTTFPAGQAFTQDRSLSPRAYNVMIGGHLIYGILLTALVCSTLGYYMAVSYTTHPIAFTIGFFVVSFLGTRIASGKSYGMALLGYTICVLGFGALVATLMPFYAPSAIFAAAGMTVIVLCTMTAAAVFMPNAFLSMGKTIFIAMIGLVIAELVAMLLFPVYPANIFAVIGLFLFSLYIGFDWARGQQNPKTASFAVMTALSLYMDVINIFIRILALTGRRK